MKVVIAAGGTAGHINPALAIAGEIMKNEPDSKIVFVGREDGMEKKLVEKAGYKLFGVEVHGFQRRPTLENILFNFKTLKCIFSAQNRVGKLFEKFQPDAVIGCGGYVSGPVVRKAAQMGIKTAIQEQNAFPGMTTRLLARRADIIFAASKEAAQALGYPQKTLITGNPIRLEFFYANRERLRKEWGVGNRVCILSFGGSLGAQTINEVAASLMKQHAGKSDIFHIHATGQYGKKMFPKMLSERGVDKNAPNIKVVEYIDNMPECFAAADLVISRSGALTISELEAAGRASVLIPSPNVSENHQYYNALTLQNDEAALLYEEKELDADKVAEDIMKLAHNPQRLKMMGINARNRAVTSSTKKIYYALKKL